MNGVIYFCQRSLQVPVEFVSVIFFLFQALKFFYQQQLEFGTYPHAKMKSNIFMGISSTIPTWLSENALGIRSLNPVFSRQNEAISPRLIFNYTEFGIIKIRII